MSLSTADAAAFTDPFAALAASLLDPDGEGGCGSFGCMCSCGDGHDHGLNVDGLLGTLDLSGPVATVAGVVEGLAGTMTLPGTASSAFFGSPTANLLDAAVTIVDAVGGLGSDLLDAVAGATLTAMDSWGQFLGSAPGAELDVQVTIAPFAPGSTAVASAGPADIFFDEVIDQNGDGAFSTGDFVTVVAGSLLEARTGTDPNGMDPDIIVNVNANTLLGGDVFVDPQANDPVPAGQIDLFSVLLHELGHGLGFLGLRDTVDDTLPVLDFGAPGAPLLAEVGFLYDFLTEIDDAGEPFFTGPNSRAFYGEDVPLEFNFGPGSDISHFRLFPFEDGTFPDLALSLMNPSVIGGDRVTIGNSELALFADIGWDVVQLADDYVNPLDTLPVTPVAAPVPGVGFGEGAVVVTVALDQPSLFTALRTGVGIEVAGGTGALTTGRLSFGPGETTASIAIDPAAFFGAAAGDIEGPLAVTLFSPAQAALPGGGQVETFVLDVNLFVGDRRGETIVGQGADNEGLFGLGGDDLIAGGLGEDTIEGGDGDDVIRGDRNNRKGYTVGDDDVIDGGAGDDRIGGKGGNDLIAGGTGDDLAYGDDGADTLIGGDGEDTLYGDTQNRRQTEGKGLADTDLLLGGEGEDFLFAGNDADTLDGGGGDDWIDGERGDDVLLGSAGEDTLTGGAGDDLFDLTAAETALVTDFGHGADSVLFADGTLVEDDGDLAAFAGRDDVAVSVEGNDLVLGFGNQTFAFHGEADLIA